MSTQNLVEGSLQRKECELDGLKSFFYLVCSSSEPITTQSQENQVPLSLRKRVIIYLDGNERNRVTFRPESCITKLSNFSLQLKMSKPL